jgi:hypothetical protein
MYMKTLQKFKRIKSIDQFVAVIVVLILVLQIRMPYFNRYISVGVKLFTSFLIIFILYLNITNNIMIALIVAICAMIILYALHMNYVNVSLGLYEGFEGNNLIDKMNNENNDIKVKKKSTTDTDSVKFDVLTADDVKKIEDDDSLSDIDGEDDVVTMSRHNKPIKQYTPAEAQRETYNLIDTVKQLELTVKNITPTLTEGKRVLEAFEKMDLDKMEI